MITVLAIALLAQLKVDDVVYTKKDGTKCYATLQMAKIRFTEASTTLSSAAEAASENAKGGTSRVAYYPKFSKFTVMVIEKSEGDTICRVKHQDHDAVYWVHAEDLGKYTPEIEAQLRETEEQNQKKVDTDKIRQAALKYAVTKPEHQVVEHLIAKGINPLTATGEQTKDLTAGQRRALSKIRARAKLIK